MKSQIIELGKSYSIVLAGNILTAALYLVFIYDWSAAGQPDYADLVLILVAVSLLPALTVRASQATSTAE